MSPPDAPAPGRDAPHPWSGEEHARLRALLDSGTVTLGVLMRRMNSPGSPVYSHGENIIPAAAVLSVSFTAAAVLHHLAGAALLGLGCAWWWWRVRPQIRAAVHARTRAHVLEDPRQMDVQWARGAITLFARMPDGSERLARRRDDWRAYVRSFHPDHR